MLAGLALALGLAVGGCQKRYPPMAVAESVDLGRYVGRWYEVASIPAPFQADCVGSQAEYSLNADGTLRVVNQCRENSPVGRLRVVAGRARVVNPPANSKLKVRFFLWLEADYWLLEVGRDYDYAVVGHPSREYLWILCRTQRMDDATYQGIVGRLKAQGYDISRIKRSPQE